MTRLRSRREQADGAGSRFQRQQFVLSLPAAIVITRLRDSSCPSIHQREIGTDCGQPHNRACAAVVVICNVRQAARQALLVGHIVMKSAYIQGGDQKTRLYQLQDAVVVLQVLSACNLVGRRLDKRRERQLLAEEQRAMKESLFKSVTGATLISDNSVVSAEFYVVSGGHGTARVWFTIHKCELWYCPVSGTYN